MQQVRRSACAVLAITLWAGCKGEHAHEPFSEPVVIDVPRGATSQEIAEALRSRGVISSKWAFLWERAWNRDATLQAGEYLFERPLKASEVIDILESGSVRLYPLTIREGLNRFDTAEVVASTGLATREEFLALTADPTMVKDILPQAETLEGCLFPDTYQLAKTSTVQDLIGAMVASFRRALDRARSQRSIAIDDWDGLILASMIEKETGDKRERALVSSVFHNRMQRGMLMQCDPTIIYGLLLEGRFRGRIYLSDLTDPHIYNTYVHEGLPPGPIANPGLESLKAAFCPSRSDYLFFVAAPGPRTGHTFSATLGDHNRAVRDLRLYEQANRSSAR